MMNYKISVITINYNDKEGLEKTIKSVVGQSYKYFEYIVIDGGSKDGSRDIINLYSDKINYWISEPDKGIYNAMNKGIAAANGDYILFINSGDQLYDENVLQNAIPHLGNADILTGYTQLVENDKTQMVKSLETFSFKHFYRYSIDHPSSFIRRKLFTELGLYDENLKIISDWKWFLLAFAKHRVTYQKLDFPVSIFTADGISSKPENRAALLEERKKVLFEEFPFFVKDYAELIQYEIPAKNFFKLKNSGWVKLGRKLGMMKNIDFE